MLLRYRCVAANNRFGATCVCAAKQSGLICLLVSTVVTTVYFYIEYDYTAVLIGFPGMCRRGKAYYRNGKISGTLKKISVMHVIKLGFAPISFPPG